jgi:hypothetical protein
VIVLGNRVEYVTLMPDGVSAGRCVRRGAKSKSLNFVDDRQAPEQPSAPMMTNDIVSVCANIGAPEFAVPRVDDAETFIRSQCNVIELVGGDVCMRIMYSDLFMHSTEHDWIEARALASVCCAAPEAFLRYAEAEAEALIREHLYVVTVLIDQLADRGILTGEELEQIIRDAVPGEMQAREHGRRREMQMRVESAEKFKETVEGP